MKLLKVICYLLVFVQFNSTAASLETSSWKFAHYGQCTPQEVLSGGKTESKWYNGGLAGPTLRLICYMPTRQSTAQVRANTADSFSVSCLSAKLAFGVPATLTETNEWSSWSKTNGHDEWSWSAFCERMHSNQRYISLRILQDYQYQGCAVYDVVTKKYNYNFLDRFIQNPQIQFQSCLKSVYLKLQVAR